MCAWLGMLMGIIGIYKMVRFIHLFPIGAKWVLTYLDFLSTGRFRILCLASDDLLDPKGVSAKTLTALGSIIAKFPASVLEQVVIHPRVQREFMWSDIPAEVKRLSEMSFYSGYQLDDVYGTYGVDPARGAIAVVRPDGYVGAVSELGDVDRVEEYLKTLIRTV